jgi:adenosylhomocysteine nucleosidase
VSWRLSTLAGRQVLFVMAAEPEYGPALRRLINPLMTGVGPVEAAIQLTRALAMLEAVERRPDLIVSLGSAGSARLEQTGLYQVTSVSYRDMDASPLGFQKGATPFLDIPVTIPLGNRIPGIAGASLSTGANIVSGSTYDAIDADMVDMESFALVRAAMAFGLPLIGLRGISDGKAELTHVSDWTEYLHIIDIKLAEAISQIEAGLDDAQLPRDGNKSGCVDGPISLERGKAR